MASNNSIISSTRLSIGHNFLSNIDSQEECQNVIEALRKELRSKQQEYDKQLALLQQKLQLKDQELQELQEREQSQKRMYDVMFGALEDKKQNNPKESQIIEDQQRKIYDLEVEIEKIKADCKMQISNIKDDLNIEIDNKNKVKAEYEILNSKFQDALSRHQQQLQEFDFTVRNLEDQLQKKDDFRRLSIELQHSENSQRIERLMNETRDKLECLQQLKQTELDCQKNIYEQKISEIKSQNQNEKNELQKQIENLSMVIKQFGERELRLQQQEKNAIQEINNQIDQMRQQNNQDLQLEKEELCKKAEKFEKLYNKSRVDFKNMEQQNKTLQFKLQQLQQSNDQSDQTREELKKLKKTHLQCKDEKTKLESKIKELQKIINETDDKIRKELEAQKQVVKKLRVENEQIKIWNSKLKEDNEKLRGEIEKEKIQGKKEIEKLKSKIKSQTQGGIINTQNFYQSNQENQTTNETDYQGTINFQKYQKKNKPCETLDFDYSRRDSLMADKNQPTSYFVQSTKNLTSRQKSAGKVINKALAHKIMSLNQTSDISQTLIHQNQSNKRNHSPVYQHNSTTHQNCNTSLAYQSNPQRNSLYVPQKSNPLNETTNYFTQQNHYNSITDHGNQYPQNTMNHSNSQQTLSQKKHQTNILAKSLSTVNMEQIKRMSLANQSTVTQENETNQKVIKKEIQRLVTLLMQKEGKLKENQDFTDGTFVIKVHSKGKNQQQQQQMVVEKNCTQGISDDLTMMVDDVAAEELPQAATKKVYSYVESKMRQSPRLLVNDYPTISPKQIFN